MLKAELKKIQEDFDVIAAFTNMMREFLKKQAGQIFLLVDIVWKIDSKVIAETFAQIMQDSPEHIPPLTKILYDGTNSKVSLDLGVFTQNDNWYLNKLNAYVPSVNIADRDPLEDHFSKFIIAIKKSSENFAKHQQRDLFPALENFRKHLAWSIDNILHLVRSYYEFIDAFAKKIENKNTIQDIYYVKTISSVEKTIKEFIVLFNQLKNALPTLTKENSSEATDLRAFGAYLPIVRCAITVLEGDSDLNERFDSLAKNEKKDKNVQSLMKSRTILIEMLTNPNLLQMEKLQNKLATASLNISEFLDNAIKKPVLRDITNSLSKNQAGHFAGKNKAPKAQFEHKAQIAEQENISP